MIYFRSVSLTDVVYYQFAELNLDYNGITVVMGHNRNTSAEGVRRNGAGKSLLLSPLSHLKYSTPTGLSGKSIRNDLLDKPTSSLKWRMSVGSDTYDIEKARKGKSARYQILRNDEDMQCGTIASAEAVIADIFPLSEEEFYSTVYLDSRRPSTVLYGTPIQRQTYLADLFQLHGFAEMRAHFQSRVSELRETRARSKALKEQLSNDAPLTTEDVERAKSREKALSQDVEKQRGACQTLEKSQELSLLRDQLQGTLKEAGKYDKDEYKNASKEVRKWELYTSNLPLHEEYMRARKKQAKKKEQITALAKRDFTKEQARKELKSLRKQEATYEREVEEYQDSLTTVEDLKERKSEYKALLKKNAKVLDTVEGVGSKQLARMENELASLEELIVHLDDHQTASRCEFCGSKLTSKLVKKRQEKALSTIEKLAPTVSQCHAAQKVLEKTESIFSSADEEELASLQDLVEPTKPNTRLRKLLEESLVPLPTEPTLDKPASDESQMQRSLREQEKYRKANTQLKHLREKLESAQDLPSTSQIKSDLKKARAKLQDLRSQYESAAKEVGSIELRYKQEKAIRAELRELKGELKKEAVFKTLVDAYSSQGLRLHVLKSLIGQVEDNLNTYSKLVFPEPFSFSLSVDERRMDVTAIRSDGKSSDVKHLSGGESRMFSLLWLISVLPMIPSNRRCNVVVLDEFESGIDETTRECLLNMYLPRLTRMIPHVIFLTPNEISPARGRRVLLVNKKHGVSTVEEMK